MAIGLPMLWLLANWVDVVMTGIWGIALTDTYTTDNFFSSFDTQYAKLFDGLRWDSGDPYVFTEKSFETLPGETDRSAGQRPWSIAMLSIWKG